MMKNIEKQTYGQSLFLSPILISFYISSPAFLMIVMVLIETYAFPLLFGRTHTLVFNELDTKIESLISVAWLGFISFKLRNQISRSWFFTWWPILAILCIIVVYLLGAFIGLPIGREERFPGVVVMLPTIGFLLFLSLISLIYHAIKSLWIIFHRKST